MHPLSRRMCSGLGHAEACGMGPLSRESLHTEAFTLWLPVSACAHLGAGCRWGEGRTLVRSTVLAELCNR